MIRKADFHRGPIALVAGLIIFDLGLGLGASGMPPVEKSAFDSAWFAGLGGMLAGLGTVTIAALAWIAKDQWLKEIEKKKTFELTVDYRAAAIRWEKSLECCVDFLYKLGPWEDMGEETEFENLSHNKQEHYEAVEHYYKALTDIWAHFEKAESYLLSSGYEGAIKGRDRAEMERLHVRTVQTVKARLKQCIGKGVRVYENILLCNLYGLDGKKDNTYLENRAFIVLDILGKRPS